MGSSSGRGSTPSQSLPHKIINAGRPLLRDKNGETRLRGAPAGVRHARVEDNRRISTLRTVIPSRKPLLIKGSPVACVHSGPSGGKQLDLAAHCGLAAILWYLLSNLRRMEYARRIAAYLLKHTPEVAA